MTKVVHIQYGMPPAGNAPYRLHEAMLRSGIDSSVLTLVPTLKRTYVESYGERLWHKAFAHVVNRVAKLCPRRRLARNQYIFNEIPLLGKGFCGHHLIQDADVIYLHWVAKGVSTKDFHALFALGKPVVVFMHDMWNITGGCHHSFECQQYQTGCKSCKMFESRVEVARKQFQKKQKLFAQYNNITFVSPSQWLCDIAKQSPITSGKQVLLIPNYIYNKVYKPIEKSVAREILNLPQDKKIICFGCQPGKANWAKGWNYLAEALTSLPYKKDELLVLLYGREPEGNLYNSVSYPMLHLGPILDEHKLMLIDNAADVFVSPSLAESFGLTLMENILCNTPVVSFDNTAIPEIVVHKQTGYLAKNRDAQDLAQGIRWALSEAHEVSSNTTYSPDAIMQKHKELIGDLVRTTNL